jgi:hypothetical protein
VIERTDFDDAGVVDQNVDLSESIDNCPDGGLNLCAIEQIAFDNQNFATAPNQIGSRTREFFTVARNESNAPAFRANVSSKHEPKPTRSATNENNLVA